MATVEQYKSGWVVKQVRKLVTMLRSVETPLGGTKEGDQILAMIKPLEPKKLDLDQAASYINEARICAVGARACYGSFEGTPKTMSVYLDELADGFVEVGKASYVSKEEAIQVLKDQKGYPIVITKVSDKHVEICRTWTKTCVYWNMEKHKLHCLELKPKQ